MSWFRFEGLDPREQWTFRAALLAILHTGVQWLAGSLAWWSGHGPNPYSSVWFALVVDVSLINCFLVPWIVGLWRSPNRRRPILVTLIGLVLEALLWRVRMEHGIFGAPWRTLGVGLGLASLASLGWDWRQAQGVERTRNFGYWVLALFMPLSGCFGLWLLRLVALIRPQVKDLYGYLMDCSLSWQGQQPVYTVVGWLLQHRWLIEPVMTVYTCLGAWLILAVLLGLKWPQRNHFNVLLAVVVAGGIAPLLYSLYPMHGYLCWNSNFPRGPGPPAPLPPFELEAPTRFPRNAMPSLHATWILIAYFAVRRISWKYRLLGLGLVAATLLGTLWVGHYFIDLVVATPYTLCVISACSWSQSRWRKPVLLLGLALLALCYYGMLSQIVFLAQHPGFFQLACLGVVGLSLAGQSLLANGYEASSATPGPPTGCDCEH